MLRSVRVRGGRTVKVALLVPQSPSSSQIRTVAVNVPPRENTWGLDSDGVPNPCGCRVNGSGAVPSPKSTVPVHVSSVPGSKKKMDGSVVGTPPSALYEPSAKTVGATFVNVALVAR